MPLISKNVVLLHAKKLQRLINHVRSNSGRTALYHVLCISGHAVFDCMLLSAVPSGQWHCPRRHAATYVIRAMISLYNPESLFILDYLICIMRIA